MATDSSSKLSKKSIIIGTLMIAFGALGIYGNFVKWSDAVQTTATVINAEPQLTRRGSGNTHLDIQYGSRDSGIQTETVSVSPSMARNAGETIDVYYMPDAPSRVIPVEVLQGKQRTIWIPLVLGALVVMAGLVLRRRGR